MGWSFESTKGPSTSQPKIIQTQKGSPRAPIILLQRNPMACVQYRTPGDPGWTFSIAPPFPEIMIIIIKQWKLNYHFWAPFLPRPRAATLFALPVSSPACVLTIMTECTTSFGCYLLKMRFWVNQNLGQIQQIILTEKENNSFQLFYFAFCHF